MSNLVNHAKRELATINEDPETTKSIVKMVEIFADMGHSGGSASVAIAMLTELLEFRNLSPLTDNPDEWFFHGEDMWGAPGGIWQNKRNGEAFSPDGGKTYYLISEGGSQPAWEAGTAEMHTSRAYSEPQHIQEELELHEGTNG